MKMDRMNKIHGICLDLLSILFILVSYACFPGAPGWGLAIPGKWAPPSIPRLRGRGASDRPAWRLRGLSIL